MEGEQVRHDRPLHCNVEASSDKAPPSARMAMAVVEPVVQMKAGGPRSAASGVKPSEVPTIAGTGRSAPRINGSDRGEGGISTARSRHRSHAAQAALNVGP